MDILLTGIVGIIFYFIGRYSVGNKEVQIQTIKNTIKKKPKAGVLPFKQHEEFTQEYKDDKKLEKHWIDSGFLKAVKDGSN